MSFIIQMIITTILLSFSSIVSAKEHRIGKQVCQKAVASSLIKKIVLSYKLDTNNNLIDIDRVYAQNAEKYISGNTWTREHNKDGEIAEYSYDSDFTRVTAQISTDTGDLSLTLEADDDGVGLYVFLNSDGPRQASFFRCEPFPFN